MCLLIFSYKLHPTYRLVLAANRDEFCDRPTRSIAFWDDMPQILAGRDLKGSGTWLGVTRSGRIAALTNFRDPASIKEQAPSRGLLVSNYLGGSQSPQDYLEQIKSAGHAYNGFNLLIGDQKELYYYSNIKNEIQKIKPGLYGVSNHVLDTPWPKVEKGKADFKALIEEKKTIKPEDIFNILNNRSRPADDKLPHTGVSLEWERMLSAMFITSDEYGTRSSSAILIEKTGRLTFAERTFIPRSSGSIKRHTDKFSFVFSEAFF